MLTPNKKKRKERRRVIDFVILSLLIFGTVMLVRSLNTEVAGTDVTVLDGDSLRIGNTEVRLHGIDAPELNQNCKDAKGKDYACGKRARKELRKLVAGRSVSCKTAETDRYDRAVSVCTAGKIRLNREMVKRGWATAYQRHSIAYLGEEASARKAKRGIWQGSFDEPEDWRRAQK